MSRQITASTTPHGATPKAEISIDAALVRTLLRAQHADIAELAIEPVASGWDNIMFRLGADFSVRLPRREVAVALLENEQRWLPTLATHLPLPIPAPIRIGKPSTDYPWCWSVLPWLQGTTADQTTLQAGQGEVLAHFLKALHRSAPTDAPRNPVRGVALIQRAEAVEQRLVRLEQCTQSITHDIRSQWKRALAMPVDVDDTWIHGDLHARNVLVHQGRLSAVIDWGDVCQGDCATDLAAIWMLLPDAQSRAVAMQAYGASGITWQRARGWAVLFGTVLLDTGLTDNPRHAAMGERTLRNVSESS